MKRALTLAGATAVHFALTATPIVMASTTLAPTEIYVTPYNQIADGCPIAAAHWTVTLDGGNGYYTVTVKYGDNYSPPPTQTQSHTIQWSYTYNDPTCSHHVYHQQWTASSGGGGTAHDDTYVTSN